MNIDMPKNMNKIKSATAFSLVMFLTACGGGGGTDSSQPSLVSSSPSTPVTAPPATSSGKTITGLASKSPISGADVSLYAIDDFGFATGSAIATGQTDDNGEFSLTVQAEIDLLLKTSGGVFIDESDQETDIALKRKITLGSGQGFMSLVPEDASSAAITPFTDLLIRRAQNEAVGEGGFMSKLTVVKGLVDTELGFDVLNTIPANPINPEANATAAQMQYALFLGAFANAVNNISLQLGDAAPTFGVIQAVAEDLGDGDLDGAYFGDQVRVFVDNGDGGSISSIQLPTNVDFARELARFRNNNFSGFADTPLPVPTGSAISNEAPTADAGLDQTVNVGSTVMLTAAGSVDPDGAALTFSWVETSNTGAVLTGATAATPSFIADASLFGRGNIAFELTITDNVGFTSTDMVEINIINAAPTADAGLDQTVDPLETVMLSGAGSVDPDGSPLIFSWAEISGSDIVLTGATTATPSFVADTSLFASAGVTFELTVTDSVGVTATDIVEINIASNDAPTADAGVDQTVDAGDTVTLTATGSVDPEGGPLTFSWAEISGSGIVLTGATTATPSFMADTNLFGSANVTFELTVTDNVGLTSTDTVVVNVAATIASSIFLMSESGQFIEAGNPIDGGVKLDFNADGTGVLIETPPVPFGWSETTDGTILLDFTASGGFIDDEFTDFGNDFGVDIGFNFGGVFDIFNLAGGSSMFPEGIEITEIINTIEIEVLTDGVNSDQVLVTISGVRERFDVTNSVSLSDEPTIETEEITAYDASIHNAFEVPLGTRILPTSARTGTPTLNDDDLYDDILTFETDGTGFALYKDHAFTWTIESDGHLNVVFADGEVADYFNFNTLADGDAIGVLSTDLNGDVISDGFLSVTQEVVSLSASDVAGIFTTRQNFDLDDGTIVDQDRKLRLYPNGTAQFEVTAIDPDTGTRIPVFLPLGRCWGVVGNEIVLTTAFDGVGTNTASEDCSVPLDEFTAFTRSTFNVLQVEGTRFRSHVVRENSVCNDGSSNDCTITNVDDVFLIISDRVPLTSTPVYAFADNVNAVDLVSSIDITVLDNDVLGDAAIDATSVVIDTQPQFGTVAVDSSTGMISYMPGVDFTGEDAFFYRVSDANGLQSSYAPVIISFDPIADAGVDIMARSGDQIMLNGSDSTTSSSVINYTWFQLNGPTVTLDDAHIASPSFSAFGLPVSGTSYEFELEIEDENGNFAYDTVFVDLPAIIPTTFVIADEVAIPFVDFGVDVDTGASIVSLSTDGSGTGIINHPDGSFGFDWSESAGSLVLDFSGSGGIQTGDFITVFENVDGLPGDEEVNLDRSEFSWQLFFAVDNDGQDLVDVIANITEFRFDVTNSVSLPDQSSTEDYVSSLYDTAAQIPFANLAGNTISLLTDVSSAIPLTSQVALETDELSFVADGTGFSRHKNETFTWNIALSGQLEVSFSGGDVATFFNLEAKESGTFFVVLYQFNSGDVRVLSNLSFLKDTSPVFPTSGIAGIYSADLAFTLDDGTNVAREWRYIVNQDGTGNWEFESVDSATGDVNGWNFTNTGICAMVNGDNEMVWYRQNSMDLRYPGSSQPDAAFCSGLTMEDVQVVQTFSLFEERLSGDLAFVVLRGQNACSTFSALNSGCTVSTPEIARVSPEIYSFTPYDGQAPITVNDNDDFTDGLAQTYNVLANDIVGDFPLDSSTVEIVVQPKDGVATVDPVTGMITVTLNTLDSSASVFYRVTDTNGNVSTISELVLTDTSMI